MIRDLTRSITVLYIVLSCISILTSLDARAQTATQPSGSGTSADPFQIDSLANLYWITQNPSSWSSHFVQTSDIDASSSSGWDSDQGFTPIGNSSSNFYGSYDGRGHTISSIYISRSGMDYIGLFGYTNGDTIQDLGLIGENITGGSNVGGLVGESYNSSLVSNCYTTGSIAGAGLVGGLIGFIDNSCTITSSHSSANVTASLNEAGGFAGNCSLSTIDSCYSTGSVTGSGTSSTDVGGFVGLNASSTIEHSHSTSTVTSSGSSSSDVGGFVGQNFPASTINNCYCTGNVTCDGNYIGGFAGLNETSTIVNSFSNSVVGGNGSSSAYVGGFVGQNYTGVDSNAYCTGAVTGDLAVGGFVGYNYSSSTVKNSYSVGRVTGSVLYGGFVGYAYNSVIDSSFWDTDSSRQSTSTYGGKGRTDIQMKTGSTFTNALWDFSGTWAINSSVNNGYPYLSNLTDQSLPVQATDFLATAESGAVTLTWKTESEINNAGFNVLKEQHGVSGWKLAGSYATNRNLAGLGSNSTGRSYSFTDDHVVSGVAYDYLIQSVSTDGTIRELSTLFVTVDAPRSFALYQNYPNPFNPGTTMRFDLKEQSNVTLEIYNTLGQMVEHWNFGTMGAGRFNEVINMGRFASGLYFYRISAIGNDGQRFVSVKKLVLMK